MTQNKKELRRYFSQLRKEAKSDDRDKLISERLLGLSDVREAETVLLYASFGSEADTWEIAEALLASGKCVAFPRCGKNGVMTFHIVRQLSELTDGAYGIREPSEELPCPDLKNRTVCIVPGLAFTEKGGRLGYGGGFYDRFLAEHPHITSAALAYEAVITNALPAEKHDIAVKYIVTEERTVLCNE